MSNEVMVPEEREVLNPAQMENYEKLLVVCDRNVNLDGRSKNHNSDFCMIKDKKGGEHIEPTRDFCLKAISIFGCNYEPVGQPTIVDDGKYKFISRDVKVSLGDRYVVETGGASTQESESSGARAFHDALGRAMTRGMKRALEALIGLPFVNMMIKELFGRYNRPEGEGRDVTPRRQQVSGKPPEPVKNVCNAIYLKLKSATEIGIVKNKERDSMWNRALVASKDFNQLKREEATIDSLLEERGMVIEGER